MQQNKKTLKIKIWILNLDGMTFWKEHGKTSWSRNIKELMEFIKDGYEVRFCDDINKSEVDWK